MHIVKLLNLLYFVKKCDFECNMQLAIGSDSNKKLSPPGVSSPVARGLQFVRSGIKGVGVGGSQNRDPHNPGINRIKSRPGYPFYLA